MTATRPPQPPPTIRPVLQQQPSTWQHQRPAPPQPPPGPPVSVQVVEIARPFRTAWLLGLGFIAASWTVTVVAVVALWLLIGGLVVAFLGGAS